MITDLKPYPAYKDSGLPWLGNIPEHWEMHRGKILFHCIDIRSSTGEEELLTVSSSRGVIPRSSTSVTMFKADSYKGYKLCWPGDLVINSLWAWGRGLGVSQYHGIVSSAYGVYRLFPQYANYSAYIHELVRSTPFNWELQVRSKGIWISRLQLTDDAFLGIKFPIPPYREQLAIIRFIKFIDRHIGHNILAKQKLIRLFEEEKHAIINHAINCGSNTTAWFKTTGGGRLERQPEREGFEFEERANRQNQNLTKLSKIAIIIDCLHKTPEYVDNGYPMVRISDINGSELDLKRCKRISEENFNIFSKSHQPKLGDIIISRVGTIGEISIVGSNDPFCLGQNTAFIIPKSSNQYLFFALKSSCVKEQIDDAVVGSTLQTLSLDDIKKIKIPFYSENRNKQISQCLNKKYNCLIKLDFSINQSIKLLYELRARLVSDMVTGKLDTRIAAARLPVDFEEELEIFDNTELLTNDKEYFDIMNPDTKIDNHE